MTEESSREPSAERVSDEFLAESIIKQADYFASFRPGSLGKEGAKHGYDALLDLRDCRRERDAFKAERDAALQAEAGADALWHQAEARCAALSAQVAALRAKLIEIRDSDLTAWGGGPCGCGGPNEDPSKCDEPELCAKLRSVWDLLAATDPGGNPTAIPPQEGKETAP